MASGQGVTEMRVVLRHLSPQSCELSWGKAVMTRLPVCKISSTDMPTWCCIRASNTLISPNASAECETFAWPTAHCSTQCGGTAGDGNIPAWRSWSKIFNHAHDCAFGLTVALDCLFQCHVQWKPAGFPCSSATGPEAGLPTLPQGQREEKVSYINSSLAYLGNSVYCYVSWLLLQIKYWLEQEDEYLLKRRMQTDLRSSGWPYSRNVIIFISKLHNISTTSGQHLLKSTLWRTEAFLFQTCSSVLFQMDCKVKQTLAQTSCCRPDFQPLQCGKLVQASYQVKKTPKLKSQTLNLEYPCWGLFLRTFSN